MNVVDFEILVATSEAGVRVCGQFGQVGVVEFCPLVCCVRMDCSYQYREDDLIYFKCLEVGEWLQAPSDAEK